MIIALSRFRKFWKDGFLSTSFKQRLETWPFQNPLRRFGSVKPHRLRAVYFRSEIHPKSIFQLWGECFTCCNWSDNCLLKESQAGTQALLINKTRQRLRLHYTSKTILGFLRPIRSSTHTSHDNWTTPEAIVGGKRMALTISKFFE